MLRKQDLIAEISNGCKPQQSWKIGMEHEQFAQHRITHRPLGYEGDPGIRALLQILVDRFGWAPHMKDGHLVELSRNGAHITIEPAGQFELSGAPYAKISDLVAEHEAFTKDITQAGHILNIDFLSRGVHPSWRREDMQWMPKPRYDVMKAYMPLKGNLGLDMMTRTCGAQVNLDFSSEQDMVRKLRIAIALQPFMTAFFANSSIVEGRDSGYASYRSHIWTDTDPDRCGILPFVFEADMGFERYVDYALNVPMYFIQRDKTYINMAGKSFKDFMAGNLPENKQYGPALIADWQLHLSTLFPEVRLKTYIELRGMDSVPAPLLYAMPAFWVGLLYDEDALDRAEFMIKDWHISDHLTFRQDVAKHGLNCRVPHSTRNIAESATQIIDIARQGLINQPIQQNATPYLNILTQQLHSFQAA